MRRCLILCLALLAGLLAACQATTATPVALPSPTATTAPVVVALPPALEPAIPALQTCARELGVPLALLPTPQSREAPPAANMRLWWGDAPPEGWQAYAVAEEQLVPITARTHTPDITADDLRRMIIGQRTTWEADATTPVPLALWLPIPESAEGQRLMAWLGTAPLRGDAALAPTPEIMLKAVADDAAALGFVPRAWLHTLHEGSPVHALPLAAAPEAWQAPVLVLLPANAPPAAHALAGCLQQGPGEKVLRTVYPTP